MSEAAGYLKQLDDAWSHDWESLRMALHGIDPAEAVWQPPAYADEVQEEGWPLPGSVLWHIAHLAHCKRYYTGVIEAGDSPAPEPKPREPLTTLDEEWAALEAAHAEERTAFAAVKDEQLGIEAGGKMELRTFLSMAARHDVWHAGQLVVARRLFRKHVDKEAGSF